MKSLHLVLFLYFSVSISFHCTPSSPSLSGLPTMEKPRSHTSSQAQWKPSDTLHYVVLVPIKADTICCQEHGDALQKGNPPLQHPLPRGFKCFWMYILCCYKKIYTVRWRSKGWTSKALPEGKCVLGVRKWSFRPKWEIHGMKTTSDELLLKKTVGNSGVVMVVILHELFYWN